MTARTPPVPKENRSPNDPAPAARAGSDITPDDRDINPDKKGQQANTKINTTHQGYQQDR